MNERTVLVPIRESSRDLIYTEKASLKRSLHILIQDKGVERYDLLLKIYRKTISEYISFNAIESAPALLGKIISYADEISGEEPLGSEDLAKIRLFIVLDTGAEIFILTNSPENLFTRSDGRWDPLGKNENHTALDLPINVESQRELFSSRLSDSLSLFKIDIRRDQELQVILGLDEAYLDDALKIVEGSMSELDSRGQEGQRGIPVSSLNNKALIMSFSKNYGFFSLHDTVSVASDRGGALHRSFPMVLLTAVVVLAVITTGLLLVKRGDSDVSGLLRGDLLKGNQNQVVESPESSGEDTSEKPAEEPRKLTFSEIWKHRFKMPVTSSPIISGSRVLFGCRDGNLYSMNWESGDMEWTYSSSAGIGASPAVYAGLAVCGDYKGNLFALDLESGRRIWSRKLPGKIVSSPVVYEGKILVGCYDRRIYCLSASSGEILWKYKTSGALRATPVCSSGIVAVASYDGYIYGLSIGTGSLRWKYKIGGQVSSSPASDGTIVVVGGNDGRIRALDIREGKLIWEAQTMGPVKSALLIAGDKVYAGSNDGKLYCLDKATGSVKWQFGTGDIILSRPGEFGDMILAASYDNSIYLLDSETGRKVASFKVSGSIFSSPVITGNRVFFGDNEGNFYCLGLSEVGSS